MNDLTEQTRDMTAQALQETEVMKTLTRYAVKDTRVMVVIAVVTTVFLPALFVAVSSVSISI
jgi:predicted metalloprotease